jgi:ribosome-associated protein
MRIRASHEKPSAKPTKKSAKKAPAKHAKPPKKKRVLPPTRQPAVVEERPIPVRKVKLENVPLESVASDEARKLAVDIATAALEKKAVGLEIIDVAGRTDYADFLVLMSGRSDRQVAALAEGIEEALRLSGRRAQNIEGREAARWILIDFGDVVVHVFQEEIRPLYDLEGLWQDARRVPAPSERSE